MPLGFSSAGYVFTKVMRSFVKKWRGEGTKASLYLDDGISIAASFENASYITNIAIRDLSLAGLTVNLIKLNLTPAQDCIYLGFIIKTKST